jgi:ankyrin repeat protein
LKQNKDKFTPEQEKKITQIKNFINKKAILIENILLTHKDAYESEDIQIIIQNIKTKWTDSFNTVGGTWNDSNVEYINLILMSVEYLKKLNLDESFIKIFNETKNIKGYTILYYYSRFGNLDIVNNIITNLTKIDLNVCNKDNSTPLHAAAWGEQNNSIEQMKNRLEIVKLLISKGADKKLVNTNKETPFKNNQNTLHTNPEIKELIKLQL